MAILRVFHSVFLPLGVLVAGTGLLFGDLTVLFVGVLLLFIVNLAYAIEDLGRRLVFLFFHLGLFLFLVSRPTITFFRGENLQALSDSYSAALFSLTLLFITLVCLRLGAMLSEWLFVQPGDARQSGDAIRLTTPALRATPPKEGNFRTHALRRQGFFRKRLSASPTSAAPTSASPTSAAPTSATPTSVAPTRRVTRDTRDNPHLESLKIAAGILFILSFIGLMWYGLLKLQIMEGRAYVDYYLTDIVGSTPLVIRTLASLEPFALCGFLAAFPSKRAATAVLLLHVCTTVPMLIIGSRGDFVLAALFCALYYLIRNYTDGPGSWIGFLEKTVFAVCLPLGIIVMGMMAYIRGNMQMESTSLLESIIDSINAQGVSYMVLGKGYQVHELVAQLGFKGYSFGSFTDYVLYGPFGTLVLGNERLPTTNGVELATLGSSYSHAMSYYAHYYYLSGEGYGSSYLLELNQDFGLAGVALFSLLFGAFLNCLTLLFKRGWLWGILALNICLIVFHMPRGAAAEWLFFVITPQFWFAILVMVGGAALLRTKTFQGFMSLPLLRHLSEKSGETHENDNTHRPARYRETQDTDHPVDHGRLRWLGSGSEPA